ncbi:hypothetical protein CIL05_05080 [Virgibacillus profundi]|uniref:NADH dehydrogenase subunit n=1 Tax=Virgibacillus profundi TaxID=2024555 RepID=A0A2A2IFD8_9BACI|nr:DUF1129 family protein [Virgibacillus profundi]PAV30479.1 hypothetical protein CIL05_05080 [Virgibacillus profundi]PXY54651.1 DUF1129 domain-containing protein [Virgibacillus profundi]
MLSNKSEQFIIELRMYLMSKGKNDAEINELTEELEDHLQQAEAEGKVPEHIVGESPREYMKSIGKEMGFDFRQIASLAPMTALLIIAYFSFAPAIEGTFSISKIGIGVSIFLCLLSFAVYGFLLVNVLPKLFHSKWFYGVIAVAYTILTGLFVVVILWEQKTNAEPFFIATPLQNNLILLACIMFFIIFAIYSKSWITILIPFFLSWGPVANRFIPESVNEDPMLITITVVLVVLITIVGGVLLFRKRRVQ